MRWTPLIALVCLAGGCGGAADCQQSADIQVTVEPNNDVALVEIARLHVMLSVADGPVRVLDIVPSHAIASKGSAFILRPDPAPADKYDVSMTVEAFDASDGGNLIAIGSESMQALLKGCNRLTVHLAALPVQPPAGDMAAPPGSDLAGMEPPPDMAGCVGGTPDEDQDGRANSCDLCPADPDSTPVDSDGDGLPDACDPDPGTGINTPIYVELFDAVLGHWSGNNTITDSYMNIDTGGVGTENASNATDTMPLLVRVQAIIFPTALHGNNGGDTGIFLGTSANLNQATGVFCALTWNNGSPDTVDIYPVVNGGFKVPTVQQLGSEISMTNYRLRLTQRGGTWTCEASASGMTPVTATTTQAVTEPLFITLENDNMGSHIHSVVAETKLP
jgi:hypothetical protein